MKKGYVGQKFDRLTVIEDLGYYQKEGTKNKRHYVKCLCECGNSCIIDLTRLKNGKTKSCGCLKTNSPKRGGKKHNNYYTDGEITYVQYTNSEECFIIDTEDLEKIKDISWYKDKDGYAVNKTRDKFLLVHRIIMNTPYNLECDHINRDVKDNRKCNLRNTTHRQNNLNKGNFKHNTSGYKGVSWDKAKNKWLAQIHSNGKHYFLGYFDNIQDAYEKRKKAEEEYFGEFRGVC